MINRYTIWSSTPTKSELLYLTENNIEMIEELLNKSNFYLEDYNEATQLVNLMEYQLRTNSTFKNEKDILHYADLNYRASFIHEKMNTIELDKLENAPPFNYCILS